MEKHMSITELKVIFEIFYSGYRETILLVNEKMPWCYKFKVILEIFHDNKLKHFLF